MKISHLEIRYLGISLDHSDVLSDTVACSDGSFTHVLFCYGFVNADDTASVFNCCCQGSLCGPRSPEAFTHHLISSLGSLVAQTVKNLPTKQETQVRSMGQEDPWRRKWQPTPVLLPEKFHGWRSLVGYSPWGRKELDMTEQLHYIFVCF